MADGGTARQTAGMADVTDRFTKPNWDVSRPGRRATPLRRDEALALLREHAAEIERRTGIRPVALFGSVARDEATADSDVDVLVEYTSEPRWEERMRAVDYLEVLLDAQVHMMSWSELRAPYRPYVEPDLLHVA